MLATSEGMTKLSKEFDVNQPSKVCTKCGIEKPFTNEFFAKDKTKPSGFLPSCKECKNTKDKRDYPKNRERILAQSKTWYKENINHKRLYDRDYREKNREKIRITKKIYSAEYKIKNPEKYRLERLATAAKRRASKNGAVSYRDLQRLVNRFQNKCAYCQCDLTTTRLEFDHVVPISRGGSNSIGNILPACRSCNRNKSFKTLMEWRTGKFVQKPATIHKLMA